jgi:hypothetical protein
MKRSKILALRAMIEKASAGLDDRDASCGAELFPLMKYDGSLIAYKTRINWHGKIKMAAGDLWDTEQNNPDNAPNLWSDIAYKDGYRYIPEVITADQAFSLGEKGWWLDELYESLIAANVYTPAAYPQGWQKV